MAATSDHEARLQAVVAEHADAIQRYCLRRLPRSAVNDVVADVFVVAWRKVDAMPLGEAALPWLYGVARNEVMKAKRRAARRSGLMSRLQRQPHYPVPGPESVVVRRAEAAEVMRALATLSPGDQDILLLRAQEGLSVAEIAQTLGCSLEAAKKRSSRALNRLRRAADITAATTPRQASRATPEGGEAQ